LKKAKNWSHHGILEKTFTAFPFARRRPAIAGGQPSPWTANGKRRHLHRFVRVSAGRCLREIGATCWTVPRGARGADAAGRSQHLHFASLRITARELRGGAIIFLFPQTALVANRTEPRYDSQELNQLITQIETHIECWKQFNHFVNIARAKKFGQDESHFLEIKSIIAQELEIDFRLRRGRSRPRARKSSRSSATRRRCAT
jgi:hypothetical protein